MFDIAIVRLLVMVCETVGLYSAEVAGLLKILNIMKDMWLGQSHYGCYNLARKLYRK